MGIPQTQQRVLAWNSGPVTSSTVSTAFAELTQIVLNDPYAPDNSWLGLSATGYSKYMSFYSKAYVLGARLALQGTAGAGALALGVTFSTDSAPFTTMEQAISSGLEEYVVIHNYPDRFSFDLSIDVAKFLNKAKIRDDPELYATASASPVQKIYAHFWSYTYDSGSLTVSSGATLTQTVLFTDPITFS